MKPTAADRRTRMAVLAAAGVLGASSVMTQLALMRELLAALAGNELVIGIGLGGWLLLTGAGTGIGRCADRLRRPGRALAAGQALIALIPLLQVLAIRIGRDLVFPHGTTVGPVATVFGVGIVLAPFCLVSGAMLTLACRLLAGEPGGRGPGRVYVADSLGSIGGGIVFSLILIPWLDHFALLCVPAAANLLLAAWLARHFEAKWLGAAALLGAAGVAASATLADPDGLSTAFQYPNCRVLLRSNSPYGRLLVTAAGGQVNVFENGMPLFSTGSIERVEETVHYPMSQRPDAREVLLISGGVTGTAREILRYGAREVTYVELDPQIVRAGRSFAPGNLADPRIAVVETDGRRFVQRTSRLFDAVIVAVADPSSWQLNRFYTAEFFSEVKRALAPGGVLALGLGHYENYMGPELARMLASEHRTLLQSFRHVLMIPGGRVFFLASDGPLDADVAGRIERCGLKTSFVTRHYLGATLAPDRLADLERAVAQPAAPNTDLNPALYSYHLRHWLSQFPFHGGLLGAILAIALAAYLWRLSSVSGVIFASGFAASASEVVLLLGFQCLYGSLYRQVGLLVTVFMAGLAAGAWLTSRSPAPAAGAGPEGAAPARGLFWLALGTALVSGLLPLVLRLLGRLEASCGAWAAGQGVILGATFLLALLVGAQFPLAARAAPGAGGTASAVYTADFVGASLGALLASALLIPFLGVAATCLLTAGLNLAAAASISSRRSGAWGNSTTSA